MRVYLVSQRVMQHLFAKYRTHNRHYVKLIGLRISPAGYRIETRPAEPGESARPSLDPRRVVIATLRRALPVCALALLEPGRQRPHHLGPHPPNRWRPPGMMPLSTKMKPLHDPVYNITPPYVFIPIGSGPESPWVPVCIKEGVRLVRSGDSDAVRSTSQSRIAPPSLL